MSIKGRSPNPQRNEVLWSCPWSVDRGHLLSAVLQATRPRRLASARAKPARGRSAIRLYIYVGPSILGAEHHLTPQHTRRVSFVFRRSPPHSVPSVHSRFSWSVSSPRARRGPRVRRGRRAARQLWLRPPVRLGLGLGLGIELGSGSGLGAGLGSGSTLAAAACCSQSSAS